MTAVYSPHTVAVQMRSGPALSFGCADSREAEALVEMLTDVTATWTRVDHASVAASTIATVVRLADVVAVQIIRGPR